MKYSLAIVIFALSFGFAPIASAQYKPKNSRKQFYGNQRLNKPLYKWVTGDYSRHGLQIQFGPTYTFTKMGPEEQEFQNEAGDTTLRYSREAKGRIGIFAEIGMVHITKKPRKFIHYYDWGLGYKHYGGREFFNSSVYDHRDTLIGQVDGKGEFYNGYLYGRFSVHNVFQMTPHTFLDNALGINVDYAIVGKNKAYQGVPAPNQRFQGDLMGQLHYNFGFGFKPRVDKGFFVIPGFRLPVLGAYEWSGGTPAIHWFSSKYYPAMFKIKFVWLFKKDPNRCPPVETNEEDRKRAKEFQNR